MSQVNHLISFLKLGNSFQGDTNFGVVLTVFWKHETGQLGLILIEVMLIVIIIIIPVMDYYIIQ